MTYADQLKVWARRREKLLALRSKGWTLRRIAAAEGISVQRVLQLVGPKNGVVK